jgi:hypothetical protein
VSCHKRQQAESELKVIRVEAAATKIDLNELAKLVREILQQVAASSSATPSQGGNAA